MKLFNSGFTILLLLSSAVNSQSINDSINKEFVEETITYLASDELMGRVNYTKEQLEAAEYLSNQFSSFGLHAFPGFYNYYMPFEKAKAPQLEWNGKKIDDSLFLYLPHHLFDDKKELDSFNILHTTLPLSDSLIYNNWRTKNRNLLFWFQLPDGKSFSEVTKKLLLPVGVPGSDILLVAEKEEPGQLNISNNVNALSSVLYNVVGLMPGRSLAAEAIIFSAHYDHVDRGPGGEKGEIFNGANDDASGTTAVLALAKYFALRKDNERTLIFCLFAGEELGLLGSQSFINYIKPASIKSVINIEMIGQTNRTGKNAFMVTGSHYSNLEKILSKNLSGEKFKIKKEGYDIRGLFRRSDNYPFALLGVPAHSIMCSDDSNPCYHKPCDDVKGIDIENMTRVIQAIAKSCTSLINGKDTPRRIKPL